MSRSTKRVLLSGACAFALLANGAAGALAQQREQQPAQDKIHRERIERDRIMIAPVPNGELGPHGGVVLGQPGDGFSFTFLSSEMPFESKIVKGAPYSAEAVSETTQVLSDGNRITRKTAAQIHRDSEGRTRRDQSATPLGPFATAEESPQTIFINDPVSGVNYVLNSRTRTAHKAMQYSFHIKRLEGELQMSQTPAADQARRTAEVTAATAAGARAPVGGGILNSRAKNGPPPVYPAVAKAAKVEGRVVVEVVVNETGQVESAQAVDGHPLLRQASVDAARQWEFAPTRLQGKPVKVTGKITFNFVLSKEEPPAGLARTHAPAEEGQMRLRVGGDHRELPDFKAEKEALGKQSFDGVEAEGTRNTVTIPAGAIGNERPIQIVSERWYSAELQAVVMSRHSDPRFGETSYRLTGINRSEPDRTLFEVPAGYQITTDGPFERRMLPTRKPKVEQ
ncbi:MAG: energy transducer TonB [Acidobacteria bacterium]|nr:energy transducer TonB [Acidobacteriota bacterium]